MRAAGSSSSPRRWRRSTACCARCRQRARRALAVQGLRARQPAGSATRSRSARAPQARRRRAVGPELRARGGARPAHRAGRRERRCRAARAAVEALHGGALRIYTSTDPVGVEVGGAVKNVLAIATGIADGMRRSGLNARAALITRGLAEMTRLGVALGARAETFMGLSGLGDLVLTATGDLSRNRTRRAAARRRACRWRASCASSATWPKACRARAMVLRRARAARRRHADHRGGVAVLERRALTPARGAASELMAPRARGAEA